MVNVAEHVYHDDPAIGHADVRTRLAGVSDFFLGNGLIQAAVQFSPCGEGTPLGLLIMDPDRLGKKRDSLTMSEAGGLTATVLRIAADSDDVTPDPARLRVAWLSGTDVPTVEAQWHTDFAVVTEQFSCPADRAVRLVRAVSIQSTQDSVLSLRLRTGEAHGEIAHDITLDARANARLWLVYDLAPDGRAVEVRLTTADPCDPERSGLWADRTTIVFHEPLLDHLFNAARRQLPAAVSARGCLDGSIWQYNREWVRDQACIALALTQLGHRTLAATMLRRLFTAFVTAEGATIDSSEVRGRDDVELDQNGILLYALEQYVRWTGDLALAADLWPRVQALADYPLRPEFRHEPSGLLWGRREYWERHAAHGIEPGFELVYQVFVAIGLGRAASLAQSLGQTADQRRWQAASHTLRDAYLASPAYALHDGRGFIKRRGLDGHVQERIVARADSGLPEGVPLASDRPHLLNPDTCAVLPIVFGAVEPGSPVAQATLASTERLWNQAWQDGGYGRYDESSEPDSPGGWPFASLFVARAAVEAGQSEGVWRTLRWMRGIAGGEAGSWFEFYGPRQAPPFPQVGVIPWTWAELVLLFVHHVLGVRPGAGGIHIRPRLLQGLHRVEATLPLGPGWLALTLVADDEAPPVSTVIRYATGVTRLTIPVRTLR